MPYYRMNMYAKKVITSEFRLRDLSYTKWGNLNSAKNILPVWHMYKHTHLDLVA